MWQCHVLQLARLGNGVVPAPGLCSFDHSAALPEKRRTLFGGGVRLPCRLSRLQSRRARKQQGHGHRGQGNRRGDARQRKHEGNSQGSSAALQYRKQLPARPPGEA
ncbi:hypothetical protein APV28_4459 [Comamonas testosteroni]|nr:hypothetical protein APV28_4459 [Comamonas testosteroni]